VPWHYWKTSVEWCRGIDGGARWKGFGAAGTCQKTRDVGGAYVLPRFHRFGAAPGIGNGDADPPAFERVDLDPANPPVTGTYTHAYVDRFGDARTVVRTFDEEMTNFANWYAYYRTRATAVKTASSLAFAGLDARHRIGLHALNPEAGALPFVNVAAFGDAQRAAWYARLFRLGADGGTPILDAMARVGEYYRSGELGGGDVVATDPVVLSCQAHWHVLFTDGITEQGNPRTSYPNQDDVIPPLPADVVVHVDPVTGKAHRQGDPWPPLFRENAAGIANSIADYATYYWATDLRARLDDDVPTSDRDPAPWQHVNFAALAFGVAGKLPAGTTGAVEDRLRTGDLSWPRIEASPTSECRREAPPNACPDASGVDDLWHAAVNGRGRYVAARSVPEIRSGLGHLLQDVSGQAGSRAGIAFPGVNLSAAGNVAYRVRFEPGWAGSLAKVEVDPATGAEVRELWRASDQLATQLTVVPGTRDRPWETERRIVTLTSDGARVPFRWDNLSPDQRASLGATGARQRAVVDFLRGDRTHEGTGTGEFRIRNGPLGDIVGSQAVYVGKPGQPFQDAGDPGYSAFVAARASRPGRVYVGANDGMLHAFDDATGSEAWAFVPRAMFAVDAGADRCSLRGLAYPDVGAGPGQTCATDEVFRHRYYVDASPRVADVDFGRGAGTTPAWAPDWRTIVVGGLGKGGRSYYAIDVTDPAAIDGETAAADRILWEFTNADMGYTYGAPLVAKTHAHGWVVIVSGGYNNASGEGRLYFLDPRTGRPRPIGPGRDYVGTGSGNPETPSGFVHLSGYTPDYRNQFVEQIYGGDLHGNLWRIDVSDPDPERWKVEKLALLSDPGGRPQPVTTPPQIEVDAATGVDRWVFVGTGRLLHPDDAGDTQTQSMYAIRDGTGAAPGPISAPVTRGSDPATGLVAVTGNDGLATTPEKGWYDDLPPGQRIVIPVQAEASLVAYAASLPRGDDPCTPGRPGAVRAREFSRGRSLLQATSGGGLVESVAIDDGIAGLAIVAVPPGGSPSAAAAPDVRVAVTRQRDAALRLLPVRLPATPARHRMSWRLIPG
jgi:type IV pilus assembly protein PilY1